jgi:hypothetical protein
VLLGDVIELREGPLRDAVAVARRVFAELAVALGPGAEVVLVPGNHDHLLMSAFRWRAALSGPAPGLGLQAELDWAPGEPLTELMMALSAGGARVRACYPGLWLRGDVYATHGHYLDRHTTVPVLERLAAGVNGRVLRRPIGSLRTAEDYEAVLAPSYAWINAVAQTLAAGDADPDASERLWRSLGSGRRGGGPRRRAMLVGLDAAIALMNRAGIGPLAPDLSPVELRRAGLIAFGAVLEVLSVRSAFAIFGHTHRAGPLDGDDLSEWVAPTGTRLLNSGCWVHEPSFLGSRPATSPYRAGFAVALGDEGPPQLLNLLDPVTGDGHRAIER